MSNGGRKPVSTDVQGDGLAGGAASAHPGDTAAYAPAREDGLKPWVRESYHFGETTSSIVYAESAADARNMYRRMHLERVRVRRATVADVGAYPDGN